MVCAVVTTSSLTYGTRLLVCKCRVSCRQKLPKSSQDIGIVCLFLFVPSWDTGYNFYSPLTNMENLRELRRGNIILSHPRPRSRVQSSKYIVLRFCLFL